jgi:hypothetical protein
MKEPFQASRLSLCEGGVRRRCSHSLKSYRRDNRVESELDRPVAMSEQLRLTCNSGLVLKNALLVLLHYGIGTERHRVISYYTVNEWGPLHISEKIRTKWRASSNERLQDSHRARRCRTRRGESAEGAKDKYKDTSGGPVKLWPLNSYD